MNATNIHSNLQTKYQTKMSSKLFLATLLTVMLAFVATPAKAVFIPNNALYINKNSTVAKIASQSETNGTLGDCICFDFKCSW